MKTIKKKYEQGELLKNINSPNDLRKLKKGQLPKLAQELRQYIIDIVSEKGGHFGASLGVVELTIAIHYIFNTPYDQLVWDVGHQAYGHKILTGRKNEFPSNRLYKGLSGFPKRSESVYDTFGVGHSSTSISAALGMSIASEKNNEKEVETAEKTPLIVKDDGKALKVLAPIQISSVESITLDTISYTENSITELAGRARLSNSVRIYLNNKLESEVKVNESGAWKAFFSDIEAGVYTLRLDEVNENGIVEGRLELPFKREEEALIKAMGEGSITVQPGNSLWRIARKYYGKGIQYVEIFERNSHLIRDPDLIYPGQIFSLPN